MSGFILRFALNYLCLFQLLQFGCDDHPAVGRTGIIIVIFLMIIPGFVKFRKRHNFGDDGVIEVFLRRGPLFFRRQFLRFAVIKDEGAVLRALVRALAIERGWIMRLPENVEQLLVGDSGRVKFDLGHLGVAGGAGAYLFVGRAGGVAAGKAAGDGFDAGQPLEDGFHAPEAAAAKRGGFSFVCVHGIGGLRERG